MATQIDLGAVVPIGKGDWNIGTTYERANIVRHNSTAWVCKVATSVGVEPTESSSDWYLLVKDTSDNNVTSVNGQKGDVVLDIVTESEIDSKINNKASELSSELSNLDTRLSEEISNVEQTSSEALGVANAITANAIVKTGSRGELAGSETSKALSGSQNITYNSPDTITMETSGAVTLTFTPAATNICAVKVISLKAINTTTLTISGAVWANAGEAPTWGTTGKYLILVANFIGGRVVINIFDNDEG